MEVKELLWGGGGLISVAILRVFNSKQLRYYGAAEPLLRAAAGSHPIKLRANEGSPCSALLLLLRVIPLDCFPLGSGPRRRARRPFATAAVASLLQRLVNAPVV